MISVTFTNVMEHRSFEAFNHIFPTVGAWDAVTERPNRVLSSNGVEKLVISQDGLVNYVATPSTNFLCGWWTSAPFEGDPSNIVVGKNEGLLFLVKLTTHIKMLTLGAEPEWSFVFAELPRDILSNPLEKEFHGPFRSQTIQQKLRGISMRIDPSWGPDAYHLDITFSSARRA